MSPVQLEALSKTIFQKGCKGLLSFRWVDVEDFQRVHFATEVLFFCISENGKHPGNRIVQGDTSMLEKKPALGCRTADTLGTSDEFSSFNQNF